MLIVDIFDEPNEPIRAGGVGTCRLRDIIVDMRPEVLADPQVPEGLHTALAWRGFNAFTHTAPQACQYHKIFNSDTELPAFIEPLVYNRPLVPRDIKKIASAGQDFLSTIDVYFIEIATLNLFSWNGFYFNQNYLERNLVKAGGKPMLKWLRSLSQETDDHEDNIAEIIDALPLGDLENNEDNRSLIRGLKKIVQTREDLVESLKNFRSQVGCPVVAVTPFVLEGDNERRVEFAEDVESAAIEAGCMTYNVGNLIDRIGREKVLAGDGADVNHFEPGIHPTLLMDMYENMEVQLQEIRQTKKLKMAS